MIALDTNVLARYIAQDDARQLALANKLIESLTVEDPAFVGTVVVVELVWVLSACYGFDRSQLATVLETLMRTKQFVVERVDLLWTAVRQFKDGSADFADCLIARSATAAGCSATMTFDKSAAKSAGMKLLQ